MPGFLCDLCLHGDFLQAVVMAWRTPFYLLVDSVFWLLFSVVLFTVLELFDIPHLTNLSGGVRRRWICDRCRARSSGLRRQLQRV